MTYRFHDDDLTAIETLLAQLLPEPKTLARLAKQARVPGDVIDPDGQMNDRWFAVVRASQSRETDDGCLTRLLDLAQAELTGTDEGKRLARQIEQARRNQSSAERDNAINAIRALGDDIELLSDLEDPMQSGGLCGKIRAEARTVWRLLENEGTAASLIVGVGVVPESSRVIRDLLINACIELVSAVDRLRGRIGMIDTLLDETGPTLRDTHQDVLRATYRRDAVIDARDGAIRRGARLLRLVDEHMPLTPSHIPLS